MLLARLCLFISINFVSISYKLWRRGMQHAACRRVTCADTPTVHSRSQTERNNLSVCLFVCLFARLFVCLACSFIWCALITRHAYAALHGSGASFIKKPKERTKTLHSSSFIYHLHPPILPSSHPPVLTRLMLMRIISGWPNFAHMSGTASG